MIKMICKSCGVEFEGTGKSKCKTCKAAYLKAWKIANPDRVKINHQKWHFENADYIKKYKKEYRESNPEQARESLREWKKRNPEKVLADGRKQDAKRAKKIERIKYMKDRRLKSIYGLSLDAYTAMHSAQNGVCAICFKPEDHLDRSGKSRQLCVDHCHKTGAIRQLLCNRCNTLIGKVDDNVDLLQKAVEYLKHHKQ